MAEGCQYRLTDYLDILHHFLMIFIEILRKDYSTGTISSDGCTCETGLTLR